jgi:hypothetical protein
LNASPQALLRRFPLTIAAVLCILVDRHIAFDALGTAGAIVAVLLRAFLSPFNSVQHQLFRLSIHLWQPNAPHWYGWLAAALSLAPYIVLDLVLGGARADRAAALRSGR